MSTIEEAKGLLSYLDQEDDIVSSSRSQWSPELDLFTELANLYAELNTITKITDLDAHIPADLFLLVQKQMFGAVSQLLRRRVGDVEYAARRVIEAAATAYRLSRHPELLEIYATAYSDTDGDEKSVSWNPSKEYKREFSTQNLFKEPAGFWTTLKVDYAMFSAMSTHAGLGATAAHVTAEGKRVLHFFDGDDKNMYRCWYHQAALYWSVLRVFLDIMRRTGQPQLISIFETQMRAWQKKACILLDQRAPWVGENVKARWAKKRANSLYSLVTLSR
jgi:hypothetical protein